jgi:hypothetical protein
MALPANRTAQPQRAAALSIGERLLGGQPSAADPVQSETMVADAPQPTSEIEAQDAHAQDQPSTEGNAPELTGDESGEQLEEQGFPSKTGAVHDRVRQLARERNQARQEAELLRQELIKSRVAAPQAAPDTSRNQQPGPPPFDRPPPGPDATDEERFDYAMEKKAHEHAWKHNMRFGQELIQAIAPALKGTLENEREKEWSSLDQALQANGTSRDEIEPIVNEILKADPRRSLRSATFDAMDRMNLYGSRAAAPTPPAGTKPGANGKPRVPGSAQPARPKEATIRDGLNGLREHVKNGNRLEANLSLGDLLLRAQDRRARR